MLKKHSLCQTRNLLIHMLKVEHVGSNFYSLTGLLNGYRQKLLAILLFETIISMCLKQQSFVMTNMFLVTAEVVTAV
jgi:hypothetical protein